MVGLRDEAVDGGLEIDHTSEDTALEALLGEFGEEPLDCVGATARDGRGVEGEARVPVEPFDAPSDAVDGVLSRSTCTELSRRRLSLDSIRRRNEFLVTMALHTSANRPSFRARREQADSVGTVALVVMGHRAGAAFLHRRAGLGAVEGLDLRFSSTEHDGMGGRIDVGPTTSRSLSMNLGSLESLNCWTRCGCRTVRAPDALDGARAGTDCFGQSWSRSNGSPRRADRYRSASRHAQRYPTRGVGMRDGRFVLSRSRAS